MINHKAATWTWGRLRSALSATSPTANGALIELDKHNWPWSMAIVPIMPVDLFELSNNHVWQTEFGIRDFGEAAADYMHVERDARGFTERGWIEFRFPELLRTARLWISPETDSRHRVGSSPVSLSDLAASTFIWERRLGLRRLSLARWA